MGRGGVQGYGDIVAGCAVGGFRRLLEPDGSEEGMMTIVWIFPG